MLETTHSSRDGTDVTIDGGDCEHGPSLEELVLSLLEGEFAGVLNTHTRGEVYGGQ